MGIAADVIEQVRSRVNLVEIVQPHIALRRVGRRWQGLCPFHAEKTPSFYVNEELGLYKCFGCNASGDVITFVREIEHLDFAIGEFREMKMQPSLERALSHRGLLKA